MLTKVNITWTISPKSEMAAPAGFEPAYSGETVRSPDRWTKAPFVEERTGFEPASSARQTEMLPFTPTLHMVMLAGFELAFSG